MSDTYQAVYDAVRSRISGGDVGAAVREVAAFAFDMSHEKALVADVFAQAAYEAMRPSVLFRPTVSLDGDMYCALYGEDLMAGCAGFGGTLAEAMADFDKNWANQKAPKPAINQAKLARCIAEQREILMRRGASA